MSEQQQSKNEHLSIIAYCIGTSILTQNSNSDPSRIHEFTYMYFSLITENTGSARFHHRCDYGCYFTRCTLYSRKSVLNEWRQDISSYVVCVWSGVSSWSYSLEKKTYYKSYLPRILIQVDVEVHIHAVQMDV